MFNDYSVAFLSFLLDVFLLLFTNESTISFGLWCKQVIRNHPSSLEIYQKKLLESGQVTKEDIDKIQGKVNRILNEEFAGSKDYVPKKRDWLSSHWSGFKSPEQLSRMRNTG